MMRRFLIHLLQACRWCGFPATSGLSPLVFFVRPVVVLDASRGLLGLFEALVLAIISVLVLNDDRGTSHLLPV